MDSEQAVQDVAETPPTPRHLLRLLHDPATIRLRCRSVLQAVEGNLSPSFRIDRSALPALADRVAAITRERYPTLAIPPHSRWRHFEAGGVDRKAELDALMAGRDRLELAIFARKGDELVGRQVALRQLRLNLVPPRLDGGDASVRNCGGHA